MALLTANGLGIVTADLVMPISRAWHGDITVSTDDASKLNGKVTIDINEGALQLVGTANVDDVYLDTVRARVVAGAGGLAKPAVPKAYRQATARIVLADLLQTAGESLSSTADAGKLATQLQSWTVMQMPVADAIGILMDEIGASWRMLPDGTFWCGTESWPATAAGWSIEQEDKAHQQIQLTAEAPLLLPGQSLDGRNISYVESHVDAKTVRMTAWVASATSADRMRDPLVAMTRSALPGVDYYALYQAQVVAQSGNTVDVRPVDPRLPQQGLEAVPLRHGVPALSVQVAPGATVLLGWDGGDPSKPYACLWGGGETLLGMSIGSGADAVATKADLTAIISALTNAVCGGSGSPITFTPPFLLPTDYASTTVKVQR